VTISTTLFLLAGVLLNAGAQLLLKAGVSAVGPIHFGASAAWPTLGRVFLQWPVLAGLACYVVSVALWLVALSRVEVSLAYPMLSLGYVVNAIAAHYLFGESVSLSRWLGIGFVIVGVWLVARS